MSFRLEAHCSAWKYKLLCLPESELLLCILSLFLGIASEAEGLWFEKTEGKHKIQTHVREIGWSLTQLSPYCATCMHSYCMPTDT